METHTSLADLQRRYLDHLEAHGRSDSTISRYRATFKLLGRFLEAQGLTADSRILTTEVMEQFAMWLRTTPVPMHRGSTQRAEAGIHASFRDLRAFVHWLHDAELLSRHIKMPMPKLPSRLFPVLTEKDLARIWSSRYLTGSSSLAVRNRAILSLMLDTGLRRAEVVGLTPADLDLDNCLLTVTGKRDKQRRVPYATSVRALILDWPKVRGTDDGSLFWPKAQGLRMMMRRIKDDIGIDLFYPHQLRHTAATAMVRNNADPFTVQRILGHSDLSITQRYVSQSDHDLAAKHAAASPFDAMLRDQIKPLDRPKRKRLSLNT